MNNFHENCNTMTRNVNFKQLVIIQKGTHTDYRSAKHTI